MRLIDKIREVYERQPFVQNKESWTFYRFGVFFFSWRGQLRILRFLGKVFRYIWRKITGAPRVEGNNYEIWKKKNFPSKKALKKMSNAVDEMDYQPLISVLIPTYRPHLDYFKKAIDSVKASVYPNWEICISDDHSQDPELISLLNEYQKDERIKVVIRTENGHISENSNSALELVEGEYTCLMDHDDLLTPDALYEVVKALNEDPKLELIYTDEDKVNDEGDFQHPHFKPDWSPDNLLSRNYIGHMVCIKSSLIKELGGFRKGYEGSQDYDLLLRATEKTDKIHHIPKVLYHWRMHEGSTAMNFDSKNYAIRSGIKALNDALQRRGEEATAEPQEQLGGFYRINYRLKKKPKISIVIPSRNNAEVLENCLESIFQLSSYENFEVILLDNNSDQNDFFALIQKWKTKEKDRFRVLELSYPFNFSRLMNDGIAASDGEYILLLNNDTEVITIDWMEKMLVHAQREEIGAVGVKLLFPNDTVQHGGVILGLGEVAGHTFLCVDRDDPSYYNYLTSVTNYNAVTAACLMVQKEKFLEVGGFDEALAVEYNDVDFCLKLREAGYWNVFVPDVELYHYESLSRGHPHRSRESYRRSRKEIKYFKSKWQPLIDNDPFFNPNLSRFSTHFEIKA